jgi:DNA modification methylase
MKENTMSEISNYPPLRHDLTPQLVRLAELKSQGRKTRKHNRKQRRKLMSNLGKFGQVLPILIDGRGRIVDGAALVEAAREMELTELWAVSLNSLSNSETRILRLALNRIQEDTEWDQEELKKEFGEILIDDPSVDLSDSGFDIQEIDVLLFGDEAIIEALTPELLTELQEEPFIESGDLFRLDDHFILCGTALEGASFETLMQGILAAAVISDPPYNLSQSEIGNKGAIQHDDFVMAAGEMSGAEFRTFLHTFLTLIAAHMKDGALAYIFMDWRHVSDIIETGKTVLGQLMNVIIWAKDNPGMGSFYRSQQEMLPVFRKGPGPHTNNIQLGKFGRNRSNVWNYPGASSFGSQAREALAGHPTPKPVQLVADAILDCTNRGGIVLDPFLGSGTTLLAAEQVGRRCRAIEIEPAYVVLACRRWEQITGEQAVHVATDLTLDELKQKRAAEREIET